jgi:hypothetical protein
MLAMDHELEALADPEFETEFEGEYEEEAEAEAFFGRLLGLVRRSPALRRIGASAARGALSGLGGLGGEIGGALGPRGAALGTDLGGALSRYLGSFLPPESELEDELLANPLRRVHPDALMEHLGAAATATDSEAESEAFLGALIPLAAQLVPRVAPLLMRAAPALIRGVTGIARTLTSNPTARPLVRAIPTVVRNTAASLARQVGQGMPVTPQTAVRTLARQAAGVLGNPHRCVQAYRRSQAMRRRFPVAMPRMTAGWM